MSNHNNELKSFVGLWGNAELTETLTMSNPFHIMHSELVELQLNLFWIHITIDPRIWEIHRKQSEDTLHYVSLGFYI